MKRLIGALLILCVLLGALPALAEGDGANSPVIDDFAGVWYVEDYILEIDPAEDGERFNCVVTQYDAEDYEGERWVYANCACDDAGQTLVSQEDGVKTEVAFDDDYETIFEEEVFSDGAATFALNGDGTLTWTDFKEESDENQKVFQKVTADDLWTPEMSYEGTWSCDRATIVIESLDDAIYATIVWGGSAWQVAQWDYSNCTYDEENDCLVTGPDGVKAILTYDEDGEVAETEQVYDNGQATFRFDDDGCLLWEDAVENAGEGMHFEAVLEMEPVIPVDEMAQHFTAPIAYLEQGTAGSSLKLAEAACEVGKFAAGQDLTDVSEEDLLYCLLLSVDALDDEDAFDPFMQNFASVRTALDDAFADWEANRGAFEDAGVGADMEAVVNDEAARASWERLRDCATNLIDLFLDE